MARTSKAIADVLDQPPGQPALNELDPTLSFICRNLIGLADDHPSFLALRENGISDLQDLMLATDEGIDDYEYTPTGSKTPQPMMSVHKAKIKWIRDWIIYLGTESGKICLSDEQWRELDKSQFMNFIVMMKSGRFSACTTVKAAAEKLAEFKKGNKRDAALYPILKDHRHWNNWNHSVLAQARAHDLKEVFDLENEPKEEDKELFEEKQNFAYAVLKRVVQADEGK